MIDPQLIFALTRTLLNGDYDKVHSNEPLIYFYEEGTEGRYMIMRGRFYYDEDPKDNHFNVSDRSIEDLKIKHVLLEWNHRHGSKAYSWDEFKKAIKL